MKMENEGRDKGKWREKNEIREENRKIRFLSCVAKLRLSGLRDNHLPLSYSFEEDNSHSQNLN
jgi:hypothetical protein